MFLQNASLKGERKRCTEIVAPKIA